MSQLLSDVNECLDPTACLFAGTCMNQPGSYSCRCPEGRTGKHCEQGNSHPLSILTCGTHKKGQKSCQRTADLYYIFK